MYYKDKLIYKSVCIVLILLHLFVFCLKDAAVVFAEIEQSEATEATPEVEEASLEENASEEQGQGEMQQNNPDSEGGEGGESPLTGDESQSQSGSTGFNLGALQNVQPSLFTGALTYSLPISVPVGRKGIQPSIALAYSSQSGNSICGTGWFLDLGSIERSTKDGVPNYDSSDTFIFKSGGSTVELVNIGGGEYRAKIEEAFMKFSFNGYSWTVKDKSGITYYFGQTTSSQQNNGSNIFKWCLDKVKDSLGNYMTLTYIKDNGQIYPDTIDYTGNEPQGINPTFQVDFDYLDSRNDYFFSYRSNFLIKTTKLLQTITVKQNGSRIRKYTLNYQQSPSTKRSVLSSVTQYGLTDSLSLPAIEFSYQEKPANFSSIISWPGVHNFGDPNWVGTRSSGSNFTFVDILDINRDGLPDRVFRTHDYTDCSKLLAQLNNGSSFDSLIEWSNLAPPYNNQRGSISYNFIFNKTNTIDINGDARPDKIYTYYNGDYTRWEVQINNGNNFDNSIAWTNIDVSLGDPDDYSSIWGLGGEMPGWRRIDSFDISGDGKLDRVFCDYPPSNHWYVQLNSANNSFNNRINWNNVQYDLSDIERYISRGGSNVYLSTFDLNGDGLPDHVMDYRGGDQVWKVQFNNGRSFEDIQSWGQIQNEYGDWSYIVSGSDYATYVVTMDINGDGLPDRVMRNYQNEMNPWQVQINNGHGFEPIEEWGPIEHGGDPDRAQITRRGSETTFVDFFDINGDGLPDRIMLVISGSTDHWDVQLNQGPHPDLLSTISNGIGGQAQITYDTYIGHDNTELADKGNLSFPVNVVTQIQTSDARGSTYLSTYSYDKGKFDYSEREFRGFGKVTATDVEGNYSVSYFHQGNYDKGRPYKQETYNSGGSLYTKAENTWTTQEPYPGYPAVKFIYLSESNSYTYNGDSSARRIKTQYLYQESPQYGNPTQVIEYGEVDADTGSDVADDKRTTFIEYTYNTVDWIVSLPARTYSEDINTNKVSEKKFYYDNHTNIYDPASQGLLTKEEVWLYNPLTQNESWLSSQYTYNEYGNLISATDANNHTTTTTYDSTYHIFPLTVSNALGHTVTSEYYGVNGVPLNDGGGFKGLFGQVKSTQDPNQVTTYNTYDDLGMTYKVIGPNDTITYPGAMYEYDLEVTNPLTDPVIFVKRLKAKDNPTSIYYPDYFLTHSFYDGLGRMIETKLIAEPDPQTGAQRQIISGIAQYNSRGLVERKYLPYFVESTGSFVQPDYNQPYVSFQYDCLGRVIQTTNPDNSYSSISYNDWELTTTDENSHYKTYYYDAYQRLIQVDEHNQGQTYTTTYQYDILGNLTGVTDQQANTTTITYDSLGRKLRMSDPDMGTWNYEYDNVGNLTRQIDAAGQVLDFQYDAINRLTQKTIQATQTVTYEYDDPTKSFSIGRLCLVTYEAGSTEFFYDNLGREIQSIKTVDSSQYAVDRSYDPLDRLVTLTYPDGEIVTYTYNPQGIETATGSTGTTYITNIDYSPTGQITKQEYGNGTVTNYTYDPNTLRLNQLQTTNSQLQTIQDLEYSFDNIGNILGITDSINTGTQTFEYDNLSRLSYANGASYGTINYSYDPIGNILTKGTLTLNYNDPRPHAVSSYTDAQTGQTVNFTYDANGNLINRLNGQTGAQTNYFYDYESHLTKVEQIYAQGEPMQVSLELQPGWNFFSLPLIPDNPDIATIFSNLTYYPEPDSYTKLLLHSDGPDGSTNFIDNSASNHQVSAIGNAQIDTAQSKFGGASGLFDGTGDYLSVPDSNDWNFGTDDWTIDFWMRISGAPSNAIVFLSQYENANNYWKIWLNPNDELQMIFVDNGVEKGNYKTSRWYYSQNTWYHLAFVRSGTTAKIFIDGVSQSLTETTAFSTNDVGDMAAQLTKGAGTDGTDYYMLGWLDETGVSKGIARWTSNFTPPTPSAGCDQVSRYNSTTDSFESYVGISEFDEFVELEYGKGYVIYINNPDGATVTITGTAPQPQGISLQEGWNLIPYPYLSQNSIQEGLGNLVFGLDYDLVLSYNQATGEFEQYPGSLQNLDPEKSYYLHCLQASTWNIEALSQKTETFYDGDGGRVKLSSQIDQAKTTTYIGSLFEKIDYADGSPTEQKKHIYAGANRVCVVDDGSPKFYHGDHLGSSNIITDQTGNQVSLYEYSPYGEVSHQSGSYQTNIKFTGKIQDDTGLYYYGARYYDPVIGRFITPDTIVQAPSDPQSLNRYAYCRNNPVKYIDPTGHSWWKKIFKSIDNFFRGIFNWLEKVTNSSWSVNINVGYSVYTDTPLRTGGEIALTAPWGLLKGTYDWLAQSYNTSDLFTGQKVYDASNYEYLFATGILTPDQDQAAKTALQVPAIWEANIKGGKGVLVAHNPSSGAAADIVESIWSKFVPFIGIKDRQLGGVLKEMGSSGKAIHAYFHSEGSIIGSNNLLWLGLSGGRLPKGSTADFIGTPITWTRAQLSYSFAGGEGLVNFKSSWKDLVTATAFPNPVHMVIGGIYAIQNGLEPHSVRSYYNNSEKQ